MEIIFRLLVYAIAIYISFACLLYLFQRSLLYPGATFNQFTGAPEAPEPFENFDIKTKDALTLRGWYKKAAPNRPTLVYFHGNADNLPSTLHYHDLITDKGLGVLLTTYRGYSGMKGRPSEQNNYDDAQKFLEALIKSGIQESDIILYGFSLGTGIAAEMATRFPDAKALVLGAPYTNMVNVAAFHYPFLPVNLILKDRYDTLSKMEKISMPVLIANGAQDEIIPASHGKALASALKGKDITFLQTNGRHVNFFFDYGGDKLIADWVLSRSTK